MMSLVESGNACGVDAPPRENLRSPTQEDVAT